MSDDNETIPGMGMISNLLRLQTQAAERHLKAVAELWNGVLEDPSAKSVLQGYSKLTQVCMDSAKQIMLGYTAPLAASSSATTDCPNVVFAIDNAAQSGGDPREVALPAHANGDLLVTKFDPKVVDAAGTELDVLKVARSADNLFAVISIGDVTKIVRPSTHTALVYLDSKPTPKLPVALVILTLLNQ
jgi:hypothetical protein